MMPMSKRKQFWYDLCSMTVAFIGMLVFMAILFGTAFIIISWFVATL